MSEEKSTYYISYGTGAGNLEMIGTLAEVMAEAEEGLAYTQESVTIYRNNNIKEPVAILPWFGYKPHDDDEVTCQFGSFGFYGKWSTENDWL